MNKSTVNKLLKAIEKTRKSKAIAYLTNDFNDNSPLSTNVASDIIPLFKKVLEAQGVVDRRSLIINTNGGNLDTAWPLVNLLREYTSKHFEVLIPSKSLSVGTLISLGADSVIMAKGAFLSPIDPTGIFPVTQNNGTIQPKKCSVEDIMGFISFAKEKVGLADQVALSEVLKLIANEYSPAIIGSVNRTHSLIRSLSKKIIGLRKGSVRLDDKKVKLVAKNLIEDLYSHQHLISLKEARELGLTYVNKADKETQKNLFDLYEYYKKEMYLEEQIQEIDNQIRGIGTTEKNFNVVGACIHSLDLMYNFEFQFTASQMPNETGVINPSLNLGKRGWFQK